MICRTRGNKYVSIRHFLSIVQKKENFSRRPAEVYLLQTATLQITYKSIQNLRAVLWSLWSFTWGTGFSAKSWREKKTTITSVWSYMSQLKCVLRLNCSSNLGNSKSLIYLNKYYWWVSVWQGYQNKAELTLTFTVVSRCWVYLSDSSLG